MKFLVEEKGFSEDRVRKGAHKLRKSREGATQGRLDAFFKPAASTSSSSVKRKGADSGKGPLKKKPKIASGAGSKFKRK